MASYKIGDVAELLGVSVDSVRRLTDSGRLATVRTAGGQRVVDGRQLARFMAKIPGPVAFLVLPFETLWTHARAGALQVGDAAPNFSLAKLDKSASVQLSNLTAQGQPVVLIFGSYT